MIGMLIVTFLFASGMFSSAPAQSVIKILQFDNNTGVIDRGEEDGIRVGDVFEVNRYAGDFVYWVGRVEVILIKPKMAGVKMIAQAGNARIQKGDMLELRKGEYDPLSDKMNQSSKNNENAGPTNLRPQGKNETAGREVVAPSSRRADPLNFGLATGLSQPLKSASQSFGLNWSINIIDSDDKKFVQVIDMARAYTTSVGLQAFCTLPVSHRFSVDLSYAYIPLNVKGAVESKLLKYGLKASASLMKVNASLYYRLNRRLLLGVGTGFFLPQVTVRDGHDEPLTFTGRQFGFTVNTAYLIPLGPRVWLKSDLMYNIFFDDAPPIQYLTLQVGPSIAIRKP
jgi:hypothetical protein